MTTQIPAEHHVATPLMDDELFAIITELETAYPQEQ